MATAIAAAARLDTARHVVAQRATRRLQQLQQREEHAAIWVVVVLIGIFVVAATVLAIYCIRHGRSGGVIDFTYEPVKKLGIPIGIKVHILCV